MSNPVLISLFTALPLIIIFIFGFSIKQFLAADFGTFDDCKVYYYNDDASEEMLDSFFDVSQKITEATGAEFTETSDPNEAAKKVDKSEAVGVITISENGFDYYRSTFNEPYGGDIVRSLFVQLVSSDKNEPLSTQHIDLGVERTGAEVYYTFVGMIFAIMFMGSLVSSSYSRDNAANTLERMSISKAGHLTVLLSKLVCGLIFGIVQMAIALPIATIVFDIEWNENAPLILAVLGAVLVFSLSMGSVVGIFIENETLSYRSFCMIVLFSSYLGGAVTPVGLLKRIPVVKQLINVSPVYWANRSIISLYNGTVDDKTSKCLTALLAFSALMILVNIAYNYSAVSNLKRIFTSKKRGLKYEKCNG